MNQPAPIFSLKAACHLSLEQADTLAICDKYALEAMVDEVDRALPASVFSRLLATSGFMTPHKATCLNRSNILIQT